MKLTGDQAVGVSIVKRALEESIRQIVVNAGVEGGVIVMEVKKHKKVAFLCGPDVALRPAVQRLAPAAGLRACVTAPRGR